MLKVVEDVVVYSVPIVLKEKDYKVFFSDKQEKDEYVKQEALYCINEMKMHFSAVTKERRKATKNLVNVRRYAFAISKGYKAEKKTKYELRK